MKLRPTYKMKLIAEINKKIFDEYQTYIAVEAYIREFLEITGYDNWNNEDEYNFNIYFKKDKTGKDVIDLVKTLTNMPQDDLLRVAVDIGIAVPMVLPAFPTFVRKLTPEETGISYAKEMFDKAYSLVLEDPAQAIGLANSTLETIIKHILQDSRSKIRYNKKDTLYELTKTILKEFKFFPTPELQENIKKIGSSLLCISSEIENLRSDKTFSHGKQKGDYVINDSLFSIFIINSIATVGLFIISFFEEQYGKLKPEIDLEEDIPF